MVRKKFDELVRIMEQLLTQDGYQKGRKKGTYYKMVSGKIMKLRMILNSVRRNGNLGEVKIFAALEYPEVEKMVSALMDEQYQKGTDIFQKDVGLLCGEQSYKAFHFSGDSNMEYVGAMMRTFLVQSVFPIMCTYEDDGKILDRFACDDTIWRWGYSDDITFYLKWVSLCALTGHIREAFVVLENTPTHLPFKQKIEIKTVRDRLSRLCSVLGLEQRPSCYLLAQKKVKINPGKEAIEKEILKLDGLSAYYLVLEDSIRRDYLQIAGGSGEYTVEIRLYDGEEYMHYRAETKREDTQEKKIFYGQGFLTLQAAEVLSFGQVYEIVCCYFEMQKLHSGYRWTVLDL